MKERERVREIEEEKQIFGGDKKREKE